MRVDCAKIENSVLYPLRCRSFTVFAYTRYLLHHPLSKPHPYFTFPDTNSNCWIQTPFLHEKPRLPVFDKAKPASTRPGRPSPRNWSANAFRGPLSCLPCRHRFRSLPFTSFTQITGLPPHNLREFLSPFSTVSTVFASSQTPTAISNNLQASYIMAKPLEGTTSSSSLSSISD
ncbi:hypothetical protein COCSADRAFT_296920 [Bipolaris sorokiniana ND90Pr]|uniref:Uncharacterized protein n=1 Tax=Cochliobolus sativus (strain ND90Pr / ATCC 201652) TaxID=665912 RepID=M2TBR1_COCSN|nr:uncharacterized protein COCSADRAFT_296920 [Bipolaris sorokiniana ND90Pr]EMD66302.1 hypothetical protein COCSADRAFT_296920 [Bipolaris sorokiniana ND90Pr]